ncbi:MAG: NADH-quinone oxidoreductase subunit K [Elusimicrobia bacterium]|nr:NADH-quinone oxidoreductase subunit K [Candidatus Liberimonas magnetica]
MAIDNAALMKLILIFVPLLFIIGFFCIIITHNMIRALIGLEILTKAVTLLLVFAGYITGNMPFAQPLVITLIIIEVVIIAVTAGVILNVFKHNKSLDVRNLRTLKG